MNFSLGASVLAAMLLSLAFCQGASPNVSTEPAPPGGNGLAGGVVFIIRHAEKPGRGPGLSPAGERRAKAYVKYFQHLKMDSKPLHLDYLVAAGDSTNSYRPRLTLQPISEALGLKLDLRFTHQNCEALTKELCGQPHGKAILICWRHD